MFYGLLLMTYNNTDEVCIHGHMGACVFVYVCQQPLALNDVPLASSILFTYFQSALVATELCKLNRRKCDDKVLYLTEKMCFLKPISYLVIKFSKKI
jgi:hypothetical protein